MAMLTTTMTVNHKPRAVPTIDYDDPENIDDDGNRRTEPQCLEEEVMTLDTGLPFFEHFYGGGVRDIRGFEDNTLGPKDGSQSCRAVGGDVKVAGGFEIAIPTPFHQGRWFTASRCSLTSATFMKTGVPLTPACSGPLAGISVTWQAPIGPIIMNYAFPIKEFQGDRTESLQFSFGTTF